MSIARQELRGKRVQIWNSVTEKFDHYRKSKRGVWIMVFPFSNKDVPAAKHLSESQVKKEKQNNLRLK